jgi:hypothetical protein
MQTMRTKIVQRNQKAVRRMRLRTNGSYKNVFLADQNPAQKKNTLNHYLNHHNNWQRRLSDFSVFTIFSQRAILRALRYLH